MCLFLLPCSSGDAFEDHCLLLLLLLLRLLLLLLLLLLMMMRGIGWGGLVGGTLGPVGWRVAWMLLGKGVEVVVVVVVVVGKQAGGGARRFGEDASLDGCVWVGLVGGGLHFGAEGVW